MKSIKTNALQKIASYLFILLFLFSNTICFSQTSISSGNVSGNWTEAGSPYQINGEITLASGTILTIDPGIIVEFQGYYKLIVEGVLLAEGTETDSIIFTTNEPATGWHGIRFESNSSTDSTKFAYCKFEYGKATGASYEATGGAIYSNGFDLISIENSTFLNNSASGGGAIYLRDGASPVIRNSKFINNEALGSADGGAIYFEWQSTAQVINNLFANNTAGSRGGAMVISNSDIVLTNNTIVNNTAASGGGAIWFHNSDGSDISILKNCIIYGNTAVNGSQFSLDSGADPDIYYCDIEGGSAGFYGGPYGGTYTDNINSDPVFNDPNAGVGNQSDAWSSDWTLQPTSPCINAGLADTSGLHLPLHDINGSQRIINNIIDMGAYESKIVPACGTISENTLWNADTVKVNCNITIDDAYVLTIDPGTVVEFQDYYSITVNGCLKAEGTMLDSIKFTVSDSIGFADTSIVDGGWAGIIFNSTAVTNDSSKFDYCIFMFGKAPETSGATNGGAFKIVNSPKISITNSLFKNNMASGMYASGGAIDIQNTDNIKIGNCTFIENIVKGPYFGGGGAINIATSSPDIYNNMFFNNVADSSSGGAIYIRDNSNPNLANNLLVNNYARYGGAVLFAAIADGTFYNNTVAFNEAKLGGGITFYDNSNPILINNIIYSNSDSVSGAQVYIFDNGSQPDFSYNNVQGGSVGFEMPDTVTYTGNYANNIDSDPLFTNPTTDVGINYNGSTANWKLQGDNPCINAGIPDTSGMNIPNIDLAGNDRIYNNVRIDIGAYEYLNNPPEMNAQSFSVNENAANSVLVGTCTASDIDGDNYTFSILSGNPNNAFNVNNFGNITVTNTDELDYESVSNQKFEIVMQVEDEGMGTLVDTAIITINLNDVNDAPVMNPFIFNLDENSINSTIVGTVSGTDEDVPAQTLSYSIIGGTYAANFAIDPASGEISIADSTPLDYETNPSIQITVQVQDNGTGNLTNNAVVTINLNDVNDYPVMANQSFSVDENSLATTSIGTIAVIDKDLPAQNLTFTITGGNDNHAFAIYPVSGELYVSDPDIIDYEVITSQKITVQVTDDGAGNLSSSAEITININNVNDNAPVFKDTTVTHSEFAAENEVIVEFETTDIDNLGGFTYSFVSGNENNIFYLQNGNGNRLYFSSNGFQNYLNYEDYQSFNLVIAVSDGDSITEANVTINIVDINESPTIDAFSFNVDEVTENNTLVGTISGTDPDIGQNLYYFIHYGNTGNVFILDSISGEIRVLDSAQLNHEGNSPSYNLQIRARDDGIPSIYAESYTTITINDVNEAPVVDPQTFSLNEVAYANTGVGTIVANHEDVDQTLSFSIIEGNESNIFSLNAETGQILLLLPDSLNYEEIPGYNFVVKVTDNSSEQLSDTALITINILDIDEPPFISDYTFTIDENSPYQSLVGIVEANDPENEPITYYFIWDNLYPPFIVNSASGEISVFEADSIDFEHRSQFLITIAARDQNWQVATSTIIINLNDLNEPPTLPHKDFYVDENKPENYVVGVVDANTDAGETVAFSITGGNYSNVFDINPNSGEIFVSNADTLNYEYRSYYELMIRATDNSAEHYWGENLAVIYVQDINDAPVINAQKLYYFKDPDINPFVGFITATDEDNDIINYSIESGNTNNAFSIVGSTGEISVLTPSEINPNETPTYNLVVKAEDHELSDTAIITIQLAPDGIFYLDLDEIVCVYPNPVKDKLSLKFNSIGKKAEIKIIDLKDQILFEKEIDSDAQIDLKEFSSGMYFLIIDYSGRSYCGKILKQ